jgi:hypothetical protein
MLVSQGGTAMAAWFRETTLQNAEAKYNSPDFEGNNPDSFKYTYRDKCLD